MLRRHLSLMAILLGLPACFASTGSCPTIACEPTINLTYANNPGATYDVVVSVHGATFQASCPQSSSDPKLVGIKACDSATLTISGVDLGHGENPVVDVSVSINGAAALSLPASLQNITNSTECDLVCFVHAGTVPN